MDSYNHPSNFMDLLQSQQDSQNPETFPSLSSQIPLFSSQYSHSYDAYQNDHSPEEPLEGRVGRCRWSSLEDGVLISAWLNTSKEPIVGNEKKADAFWRRIAAYYASSPAVAKLPKREASQCKQRWHKINDFVNKFVGCYAHASGLKASGQSEDDTIKLAYQLFQNDHKVRFTLEHAWRELRHDPKWQHMNKTNGEGSSKKRKLEDGSAQSSGSNTVSHVEEEATPRPPGVKAAKAKGKQSASKTVTEEREATSSSKFEAMWAIRKEDLACRENLAKMKILESLVAKTEPLDEIESTLKKKLMTELLSTF